MPSISVIISTYNKPHFLEKVLTGYCFQTFNDFEIIIADDGSSNETKEMITKFEQLIPQKIYHVWHEDNGFRKCKILNTAIMKSSNDYLVFSDGDCIPDSHFLETHSRLAQKGYFLSGGHFPITEKVSNLLAKEDIKSQICFTKKYLLKQGQPIGKNYFKLVKNQFLARFLDELTPTKATFNGNNSSQITLHLFPKKSLHSSIYSSSFPLSINTSVIYELKTAEPPVESYKPDSINLSIELLSDFTFLF